MPKSRKMMFLMKQFFLCFVVIIIMNSCSSNNSDFQKKENSKSNFGLPKNNTLMWPQRAIEDSSTCGCGNFSMFKKVDSLGPNFWFAFETKIDFKPIRGTIPLNFPRDTAYFHPYLVDFSTEGHCLAPFCREIFINIKPCKKGKKFEILNGDALLFCSDGYREGQNKLNPKLYYVAAIFQNLVFVTKEDTIKVKTLKIPATIIGWTHG
jgi:hypothetical protein